MEVLMSDPLPKAVAPDMLRTCWHLDECKTFPGVAVVGPYQLRCLWLWWGASFAAALHVVVKDPIDIYKLCEKQWTAMEDHKLNK
jgi:hypothetical protein